MTKRPELIDPEVYQPLVKWAAQELKGFSSGDTDVDDEVDLVGVLAAVLDDPQCDGYNLARALDDTCGYEGSEQLVDTCSHIINRIRDTHVRAVQAWVRENKITLDLPVGRAVEVYKSFCEKPTDGGIIHGRDDSMALYKITVNGMQPNSYRCYEPEFVKPLGTFEAKQKRAVV